MTHRMQVTTRGAATPRRVDRHRRRTEPFLLEAIVIRGGEVTRLSRGLEKCVVQRVVEGPLTGEQGAVAPAIVITTAGKCFGAFEVREDLPITPPGRAHLDPVLVVQRVTADKHHAVDRR